jgi:hypothetical protein
VSQLALASTRSASLDLLGLRAGGEFEIIAAIDQQRGRVAELSSIAQPMPARPTNTSGTIASIWPPG